MLKRGCFQFHLSTAVAVMFGAGGLYYVNLTPYLMESAHGTTSYNGSNYENDYRIFGLGWPAVACRKFVYGVKEIPEGYYAVKHGLYVDIAAALGILGAVAGAAEFFTRMRGRRKQQSDEG